MCGLARQKQGWRGSPLLHSTPSFTAASMTLLARHCNCSLTLTLSCTAFPHRKSYSIQSHTSQRHFNGHCTFFLTQQG